MPTPTQPDTGGDLLRLLAARSAPLAASSADGAVRDTTDVASRLEAVRRSAPPQEGSCSWTGWGS